MPLSVLRLHYLAILACVSSLFLDTSAYSGALDVVSESVDNESIESRISNYGEEDTDAQFNKSLTTRLIKLNNQASAIFIVLLLVYLRRNWDYLKTSHYTLKLYNVLLLFIAVSYALISFSVVGQRFVYIALVLLYMLLLNLYQDNRNSNIRLFIYAMPVVFSLHIMWTIYNCYCNTGLDIYYQPLPLLTMQHVF